MVIKEANLIKCNKGLVLPITCDKCSVKMNKYLKKNICCDTQKLLI